MYLITKKDTGIVEGYGASLDYMKNGYPRLVDINTAWPKEVVDVFEVLVVPEDLQVHKYCYSEADGFTINPDWEADATEEDYLAALAELGVDTNEEG